MPRSNIKKKLKIGTISAMLFHSGWSSCSSSDAQARRMKYAHTKT